MVELMLRIFWSVLTDLGPFLAIVGSVLAIILSGVAGYVIGVAKSFRDQKHRIYSEVLSPILKFAYNAKRTPNDETEFNKALCQVWLYCSREVALKMDRAAFVFAGPSTGPSRGDFAKCIQGVIAAMRNDVQLPWLRRWQQIRPSQIEHFYFQIAKQSREQ